jgi:hypothetical protein
VQLTGYPHVGATTVVGCTDAVANPFRFLTPVGPMVSRQHGGRRECVSRTITSRDESREDFSQRSPGIPGGSLWVSASAYSAPVVSLEHDPFRSFAILVGRMLTGWEADEIYAPAIESLAIQSSSAPTSGNSPSPSPRSHESHSSRSAALPEQPSDARRTRLRAVRSEFRAARSGW